MITNEHVVAMMKAAIRETQDMPMFVRVIVQFIFKVYANNLVKDSHLGISY